MKTSTVSSKTIDDTSQIGLYQSQRSKYLGRPNRVTEYNYTCNNLMFSPKLLHMHESKQYMKACSNFKKIDNFHNILVIQSNLSEATRY